MTEGEAKTKWCPFARVTAAKSNAHDKGFTLEGPTAGPFNRLIFGENNSGLSARMPEAFGHCLASDCMAWRVHVEIGSSEPERSSSGYCGLAGRP